MTDQTKRYWVRTSIRGTGGNDLGDCDYTEEQADRRVELALEQSATDGATISLIDAENPGVPIRYWCGSADGKWTEQVIGGTKIVPRP